MLPPDPAPFTLRRGFAAWLRDSLRRTGFWRTAAFLAASVFELLRDCLPSRLRLRFGDLEYDWENRVDTTWANVRLGTRLREIVVGRQYQPTDPVLFREVLGTLALEHREFTLIDLGSGKGRALLLASEFPFRRILGVELLPELHAIAERNVRMYRNGIEQERIELWCGDARQFAFPEEPLVVFLFDPFPKHILEEVMRNLERSWRARPRRIVIVYQNPISEQVLSHSSWLHRCRGDIQYAVYRSEGL